MLADENSAVSYVEPLGCHELAATEDSLSRDFFAVSTMLLVAHYMLDQAVRLRQQHRMSMGDTLVVATALVHRLHLAMHNVRDFV